MFGSSYNSFVASCDCLTVGVCSRPVYTRANVVRKCDKVCVYTCLPSFGANLHGYLKLGGRKHEIKWRKACDIAVSRVFSGVKRVPVLYKYFPAFPSKFVSLLIIEN